MHAHPPLPPGVTEVPLGDQGLRAWRIETPACQALVSQQGGQVLEFQARGQSPLLWCSPRAAYAPGRAIRGGIPLCFPWFGPAPGDAALPAHGFARSRDWTLVAATVAGAAVQLELALVASADTRALWPHAFEARLRLVLDHRLSLHLTVTNPGAAALAFRFAFHSYFPLADCTRARVEGLEDAVCIDQLDAARSRQRHTGALRFQGETDRVFLHTGGRCQLVDEVRDRRIHVTAPDCRSVIAWNPGPDKAARLSDFGADAWRGMACVESGNIEDDGIELPAGAARCFTLVLEG